MTPEAKAARREAMGFDPQPFYHANAGGIVGGFDEGRLPKIDPDAPFSAHWFLHEPDEFAAYRVVGRGDTITPAHIRMTNPADMPAIRKVHKYRRDGADTRQGLDEAGYTHVLWNGREPINAEELSKTGETTYRMSMGGKRTLRNDPEFGGVDMFDKDGQHIVGYEDLADFEGLNPERETVAVLNGKHIRSPNATFNPSRANRRDLLAAKILLPLGIAGATIAALQPQPAAASTGDLEQDIANRRRQSERGFIPRLALNNAAQIDPSGAAAAIAEGYDAGEDLDQILARVPDRAARNAAFGVLGPATLALGAIGRAPEQIAGAAQHFTRPIPASEQKPRETYRTGSDRMTNRVPPLRYR
jgi:hypothetical protein